MKKKVMMIIVTIVLILLASNLIAATTLTAELSSSVNELKEGETLVITLKFDEYEEVKNGLNAYKATLEYDKEIFEEVEERNFVCENDWEQFRYNKTTGEFIAIKRAGSIVPEEILKITLKAKEGVKASSTDIKIKDIVASEGEKDILITETKVTINILEEQEEKPEEPKQEKITSTKYDITQGFIEGVLPKTTVKKFTQNVTLENVTTDPQMVFTNKDGIILKDDDMITTGTKLKVGKTLQYTLVVIGDIDCDSEITINDLAQMKLHLIDIKFLEGVSLKAADIDKDGEITLNDLAKMKLILLDLLKL